MPDGDSTRLAQFVRRLKLIEWDVDPSAEDRDWAARNVAKLSVVIDWSGGFGWHYGCWRPARPDTPVPHPITCGLVSGLMPDAAEMAADSLYCEWGYVADLDRRSFEVYEGLQQAPHADGRFADRLPDNVGAHRYYPLRLVAAWPFDALPDREDFLTTIL